MRPGAGGHGPGPGLCAAVGGGDRPKTAGGPGGPHPPGGPGAQRPKRGPSVTTANIGTPR